ncbi:MAG: dihydrolipoamide acetyltransferase family protein, partial [Alphaproteobacteria bacterium]
GTGPRGRIHKADIELAVKTGSAKPQAASANASAAGSMITIDGDAEFELVPLNGMRKTIAKRLVEAKQTVPHFYLSRDMALDELLQARKVLNAQAPETDGKPAYKLSVNDLVIKACAMALMKVPKANAAFTNDGIQLFKRADISIAVATDGGLITPVIRGANHRGMIEISSQMKQLASKARAGKLMPEEYQGGSFTISNLGMFGIEQFQAIINPPQACILAVGAGVQKPVVVNGEIKIRNMVTMTLSVDHRAVDGALGAQLLDALKTYIENPVTMLA